MLFNCRSDGRVPYVISIGGSSTTGVWGYIEAFKEMMQQVYVFA